MYSSGVISIDWQNPLKDNMNDRKSIYYTNRKPQGNASLFEEEVPERITIKNFGPLRDIENLEIKPYTFLIGESAEGKSTLMKVMAMMRYLYKMANIRSYLRHSKITKSPFGIRLEPMMERQGMHGMLTKESLIVYSFAIGGARYEVRIEDKKLRFPTTIPQEHLVFYKNSYISENRNMIPTWVQTAWKNKGAALSYYFHETNSDFAAASEGDKSLEMDYVGMKLLITHPKGKPTRYQITPSDEHHKPIELTEASSGIQTSAPLALIVNHFAKDFSFKEAFNRSVLSYLYETENLSKFQAISEPTALPKVVNIHIEEPELSLFPDAQCRLIERLVYTTLHAEADRGVNMMIATHSPYILNYLNILLNQTKEGRARLTPQMLAAYRLCEGTYQNLVAKDDKGRDIVDSSDLAEMMSDIYNEFVSLGK